LSFKGNAVTLVVGFVVAVILASAILGVFVGVVGMFID